MTKPIIVVKICYKLLYVIQVVKKILAMKIKERKNDCHA